MRRAVAAVALVGVIAVQTLTAAPAAAHATLESSTPASGAMLADPPEVVELVFSESIGTPAELVVLDAAGHEVDGGPLQAVDRTLRRSYAPSGFTSGAYTVSYEVTSADGHPVSGTLSFMVHGTGEPVGSVPVVDQVDPTDADPATVLVLAGALAAGLGVALVVGRRLVADPSGTGPAGTGPDSSAPSG
jgi:methionine-rich copper-binding protein CopC